VTAAGPAPSLQTFTLADLAQYKAEGVFAAGQSSQHALFYVGRDDVHGVLTHIFSRVTQALDMNMFGYDDADLNALLMGLAEKPSVRVAVTLDKSQSGGAHEKQILDSDAAKDPAAYNASFAIGQSATHQISHTKGGVADNAVGWEGSTNLSKSGEGTFVVSGKAGGKGYVAQNNTLMVFTDPGTINQFREELQAEHRVVLAQGGKLAPKTAAPSAHPVAS
jgi:hypothetical protein